MTQGMKGASVLVIGPYPPPVHGAAVVTAAIADRLASRVAVRRCDLSPGSLVRGVLYHLRRAGCALAAAGAIADRIGRPSTVYLSAAGGIGLLYNILHAAVARLLGQRLVIHHHSFAYLDRPSIVMALLARVAGVGAMHVVLCTRMADLLRSRYPAVRHVRTVSNAAFFPPGEMARLSPKDGVLRLGHMGNLTAEKGLDLVLDLGQAARDAGLSVRLVLAGPPADEEAVGMIAAASALFPESCEYRGAVHGVEKDRFFADIDVFLFPTRYVNEAEPTVLFEAMVHGVPSIAYARGCIGEQLGEAEEAGQGGIAVPVGMPFVDHALERLRLWTSKPELLDAACETARSRAARLHDVAAAQLEGLLTALAGQEYRT